MNVNNFAIHSQNQLGKSAFMVNGELTRPSAGALDASAGALYPSAGACARLHLCGYIRR